MPPPRCPPEFPLYTLHPRNRATHSSVVPSSLLFYIWARLLGRYAWEEICHVALEICSVSTQALRELTCVVTGQSIGRSCKTVRSCRLCGNFSAVKMARTLRAEGLPWCHSAARCFSNNEHSRRRSSQSLAYCELSASMICDLLRALVALTTAPPMLRVEEV